VNPQFKSSMSSKDPEADYKQASELKIAGNEAFKAGDLKGALKNYSRIFMHIGMNPCMNMSQMMGGGGAPPDPSQTAPKDPIQQKTDALRLDAFNNMAAVYAKMSKWDDCKEKCSRVLKVDDKNRKALFRRGMAHRKLNLYELARADLDKAKEVLGDKKDAAIERELKLLEKDEKNADKVFYAKMKNQFKKAQKQKDKKKAEKLEQRKKAEQEEAAKDDNPNLKANANVDGGAGDDLFVWDQPQSEAAQNTQTQTTETNVAQTETQTTAAVGKDKTTEQPSEF